MPESLLDLADTVLVDWYVVFVKADYPGWWQRFLKPGYQHVYAVKWDGYNWILFAPNMFHTEVSVLPVVDNDLSAVFSNTEISDILRFRGRIPTKCSVWLPEVRTCVSQVKALIGVRKWWVLTPWQLAKHMRREHERLGQQAETA